MAKAVKIRVRKDVAQVVNFKTRVILHRTDTIRKAVRWAKSRRHSIIARP